MKKETKRSKEQTPKGELQSKDPVKSVEKASVVESPTVASSKFSWTRVREWFRDHRTASITSVVVAVCLIGGGVAVAMFLRGATFELDTTTTVQEVADSKPSVVEKKDFSRRLDGVEVKEGENTNSVPIMVMIENLEVSEVRPQAGLSQAPVVYETIAEASITRFAAIFLPETLPDLIGPVRSSRHYYLEFQGEYDNAPYAHAGGSPEAMQGIASLGVRDVSALSSASRYFYRAPGYAPHNLFTKGELMKLMLRDFKFDYTPNYGSWIFQNDPASEQRASSQEVVIDWASGSAYDARYVYDPATNLYARFHGDDPHKDRNNNQQIQVKNLLIQRIPAETYLSSGKGRVDLNITGEGSGWVIRDGQAIEGTWKKATRTDRTRWYDQDGKEISLRRGTTWVHVVPGDRAVTITPAPAPAT